MALDLFYITNRPEVALVAQTAGVNRIWIDMEFIGKDERQKGLDTVKSHHTFEDIAKMRSIITTSNLMVRVNPLHDKIDGYVDSSEEINRTIQYGADEIMLPMFRNREDVERFIDYVGGRCRTILLVETPDAVRNIEDILAVPGIDEVHIGLNDLHLAYNLKFMFELLSDGTVASLCKIFKEKKIKYGFGGIARLGYGLLPAEYVIAEHYYYGSSAAILSRSFCNADRVNDIKEVQDMFMRGVKSIRQREQEVSQFTNAQFKKNHLEICKRVTDIVERM